MKIKTISLNSYNYKKKLLIIKINYFIDLGFLFHYKTSYKYSTTNILEHLYNFTMRLRKYDKNIYNT